MSNCLGLSSTEVARFQTLLGPMDWSPTRLNLEKIVRKAMGTIPFTNIMMLARARRAPTHREIIEDMLNMKGGPCGHYNPFMVSFLTSLGFNCYLAPAWMDSVLSHIAVVVIFEDTKVWFDCGNGHPYLTPLELIDGTSASHAGLHYELRKSSNQMYELLHQHHGQRGPSLNYVLKDEPVPFETFSEMISSHYTDVSYGPFLSGLRLVLFPEGELYAIRDFDLLTTKNGVLEKRRFQNLTEMSEEISLTFSASQFPLDLVFAALEWSE